MNVPANLQYTKDHEWVKIEDDNAIVGITDFAQRELGDIVFVSIDKKSDTLKSGDIFGTVEAVKTVSDLYMPVNGCIIEINPKLESEPEAVNSDPYGDGWMIKVKMNSDKENNSSLLSAEDYKSLIK